jgi:hypothetical protein
MDFLDTTFADTHRIYQQASAKDEVPFEMGLARYGAEHFSVAIRRFHVEGRIFTVSIFQRHSLDFRTLPEALLYRGAISAAYLEKPNSETRADLDEADALVERLRRQERILNSKEVYANA